MKLFNQVYKWWAQRSYSLFNACSETRTELFDRHCPTSQYKTHPLLPDEHDRGLTLTRRELLSEVVDQTRTVWSAEALIATSEVGCKITEVIFLLWPYHSIRGVTLYAQALHTLNVLVTVSVALLNRTTDLSMPPVRITLS